MKVIGFVLTLFLSSTLFAEEGILGYWLTPGSIVKIENCDTYVCAKIETIFVDDGQDPKLILDENNRDKALRSRAIVRINILSGFLIKDVKQREFKGGRIYDPRRGREFKSNLHLKEGGNLEVEGCLAFICDSEEWLPLVVTINDDGTKNASLKYPPRDNQP